MPSLPYDIEKNVAYQGIRYARLAFLDVATGKRVMCLICSETGLGKSLEAKRAMKANNTAFYEFGVTQNEYDLVSHLWSIQSGIIQYKGRRIVVIIADDKDGLARRETILNHFKRGFGGDHRSITFPSDKAFRNASYKESENEKDRKKYRASIPPPSFDIEVRLIWLSNLNYTDPGIVAGLPIHFHAMVSKGLDPYWISNDAEHDGHDLFLYVHWLATERNSLGGEGYSYAVARQAVQFYVKNVHRLIDIPPRRLSLIAKMIADNPDPAERKERLEGMLRPTDQRPRLKVPESWVPVLLWPQNLPRRSDSPESPPDEPDEQPPQSAEAEPPVREPVPPPANGDLEHDPPASSPPKPNETMALDAILDAELGSDAETRKGAFFSAIRTATEMGILPDDMAAVLPFVRDTIASNPDQTRRRLFGFVTARGILGQASEMIRVRGGYPENTETPPPERTLPLKLKDVVLTAEDRDRIPRSFDLAKFRGRTSAVKRDRASDNRIKGFWLLEQHLEDQQIDAVAKPLRLAKVIFWLGVEDLDIYQIVARVKELGHIES